MMNAIYTTGVMLFALWLVRTRLGRYALVGSPVRRNVLPILAPLIAFALWFLGAAVFQGLIRGIVGPVAGWHADFLNNLAYCLGGVVTVGVMLFMARLTFARGLKGFGLRLRTIPRDFGLAALTLWAVWPLVLGMITATLVIGKRLLGPQFEMPVHMELRLITESTAVPLVVIVVISAVVVAPVVEETLFRGMIQTVLRSYLGYPWLAIALASAIFASVHANGTHWPALFVLSMGLGYAYEKSGSLYRSIFMHALFNGISILATLLEPAST